MSEATKAPHTAAEFEEKLAEFVAKCQAMIREHFAKNYPRNTVPELSAEPGQRYIRIVSANPQRSAYCFIDSTNGNILKAAGWKKPAPQPRGNIFDADPMNAVTVFGAAYLR